MAVPEKHWPFEHISPCAQSQWVLQVGEMALHFPVAASQVLLAMVWEVLAHWPLAQEGVIWMQLVPLCEQESVRVEVLRAHWLLLQAGVNWVQVVPLMEQ